MGVTRYAATATVVGATVLASMVVLVGAWLQRSAGDAARAGSDGAAALGTARVPWALLGTVDRGRALRVLPLSDRPACGRFRASARDDAQHRSVEVDVFLDDAACAPAQRSGERGESTQTAVAGSAKSMVVRLDRSLDGRTVIGADLEMRERSYGDRVVDLRGLSVAQADEVATMLRATLDVHGPDAQDAGQPMVSRQRPLNIGPGQRPPGDVYDVFTRASE